jgi:hypothetical protein
MLKVDFPSGREAGDVLDEQPILLGDYSMFSTGDIDGLAIARADHTDAPFADSKIGLVC